MFHLPRAGAWEVSLVNGTCANSFAPCPRTCSSGPFGSAAPQQSSRCPQNSAPDTRTSVLACIAFHPKPSALNLRVAPGVGPRAWFGGQAADKGRGSDCRRAPAASLVRTDAVVPTRGTGASRQSPLPAHTLACLRLRLRCPGCSERVFRVWVNSDGRVDYTSSYKPTIFTRCNKAW